MVQGSRFRFQGFGCGAGTWKWNRNPEVEPEPLTSEPLNSLMSYQVLARKWRPQQFDDVVGQPAVTRTLANAIKSGRIAQAFVFAGPRGVGKTTTARILARALNCEKGPTADPCGVCDACREIAEGRDIDVLEIDAATHTQVDNVREVIIAGLSIVPVRNRYKVFIIDEVHQLSTHSFNALLKSIEEPPPHVVFMMATTELAKIPETVLSRSQVFEFQTISSRQIADQLRKIADAEKIAVDEAALLLIARAAEGSMRDAQSALDQVIAFAGDKCHRDDVATVLGLVGRDLVFDIVAAVADETPAAAFELVRARGRARLRPALGLPRALARRARPARAVGRSVAHRRSGDRRRERARAAAGAGRALLARGSAARVRPALEGRGRHPRRGAAAVSPRDGAAAVDSSAQAGAADRVAAGEWRMSVHVGRVLRTRRPTGASLLCDPDVGRVLRTRRPASLRTPAADNRSGRSASRALTALQRVRTCQRSRAARPERRVSRRNPEVEGVLLQHRRRAGTEDRVRARSRDVHVSPRASHACASSSSRTARGSSRLPPAVAGKQDAVARGAGRRRRLEPPFRPQRVLAGCNPSRPI